MYAVTMAAQPQQRAVRNLRLELAAFQTARLEVQGTAIVRCVAGRLRITQSTDRQDYFVTRGMYFATSKQSVIVLASLDDSSTALVALTEAVRNPPPGISSVHIDYEQIQSLIDKAQRMRAAELRNWCAAAWEWGKRLIGRLRS